MSKTITIIPELEKYLTERYTGNGLIEILTLMREYASKTVQVTGNRPTEPKCVLGKHCRSPADDNTMRNMRARAWHEQGVLMIKPSDLSNGKEKDWLVGYAVGLYGEQ